MIYAIGVLSLLLLLAVIFRWKPIWEHIKGSTASDRYSTIVFTAVLITSLILLIISTIKGQDQNLLLALILLTITSVTISVLMDRVGVLGRLEKSVDTVTEIKTEIECQDGTLKDIEKRLKDAESFRTRSEIENEYPLNEMWEDAKAIKVVTMGGSAFFIGKLKGNVDGALEQGASFTFVNIKQESDAWKEHYNNKMENKTEGNMVACLGVPRTITDSYNGKITYYQTEVNIPYAIMFVEKKNPNESFVKVDLYSIGVKDKDRPCMLLYQGDPHFEFFKGQIEMIIQRSEKIQ